MTAKGSLARPSLWAGLIVIVIVAVGLALPGGRRLGLRFLDSLRMGKTQPVNISLSAFVGPIS